MKKITFIFLLVFVKLFSQDYTQYVNPFIGTGGHGHTFPGAIVPFGMVQLSPDTRIDGSWDGCSGYHYSDKIIYGFSHTHLNGTGVSDYGDIMLMPTMGTPSLDYKDYSSEFSHKNEKATAGFYQVKLNKHNIDARLTTTVRVAYHEYSFNKNGQANIIVDLNHRDELTEGEVKIIDSKTIEIFRRSKGWAVDQHLYSRIEFSKPMKITKSEFNGENINNTFKGTKLKLAFSSDVKNGEKILVKVALSPTSYEGARKNMLAEGGSNDFNSVKKNAEDLWNKELRKIEVKSNDKNKLSIFYTALYHVFTQPNIAMDVDGNFRGMDGKIHKANGFDYYTIFSLWDTFRAYHPLMTLIDKKRTSDFINTFINQYEQGKRLPIWELASNETYCMIGYHSVSVIADAMAKNIKSFDYLKAFEAAKNSANNFDDFGMKAYRDKGYITIDDEHESVSKTLEYAYDDWCIAQMALMLNKKKDYETFMKRSEGWKNLYNPENGFMQARKNGNWLSPFEPREVNNNYTEGNSWHYSYFVPQNIPGLMEAHGGKEGFEKFVDAIFSAPEKTTGREQVDITGLIGQYAHGNEPSHHIAYLYNYLGKPEKTKEKVHYILENFYKNTPDGLIGNEDCGQMSAWYILSSMGIYNVTPGQNEWHTVEPFFDEIKINFEDGTSRIITKNNPPQKNFGFENVKPLKQKKIKNVVAAPVISASEKAFDKPMIVEIKALNPKDKITYSVIDFNSKAIINPIPYKGPFMISKSSTVMATSINGKNRSSMTFADFIRKPNNWSITLNSKYNPQYDAGGNEGLIDGKFGDENWRKGNWQGYQSQDFEAVIDLKMLTPITEINSRYLQDSRSWILMPAKVEYYLSSNNKDFFLVATVNNSLDPKITDNTISEFKADILQTEARYLKVKAYNYGKLPEWHQGFGGDAFIFVDEIWVK